MAVVSQEPFLFDGTIRENIRYGRLDASEEEILAAARAAHVDEFAEGLPDGYDTEVGAAGTRLSGGQRQRVTIARAILRDPAILVLDEATSSLDSKSERLVQDAIEKLMPGRTVFVIAHRLSTVRAAHKIVVLEHGRVSQLGTHDELLAAGRALPRAGRAPAVGARAGSRRWARGGEVAASRDEPRRLELSGSPRRARRRAPRAARGLNSRSARARAARPSPRGAAGRRAAPATPRRAPRAARRRGSRCAPSTTSSGSAPRREVTAGMPHAAASSSARQPPSEPGTRNVNTSKQRSTSA